MDRAGGEAKREEIGNVWNFWKLHGKRDLSLDRSSTRSVFRLGAHVASTIYGILRFSSCPLPLPPSPLFLSLSLSRSLDAFIARRTSHLPFLIRLSSLPLRLATEIASAFSEQYIRRNTGGYPLTGHYCYLWSSHDRRVVNAASSEHEFLSICPV